MINISNNEHWLVEQAKLRKDNIAILTDKDYVSYSELMVLVNRAADFFIKNNVKKNDHIAVLSENNLEFIITINALWLIGAIPIPLNIKLRENELCEMIEFSDSDFIIIINNAIQNSFNLEISQIDFTLRLIKNYQVYRPDDSFDSSKICLMMFTSGSTGFPKCVELTFDNLYYSAKSVDSEINHNTEDLWLASLPFYHIGGFSIITRTIFAGCKIFLPNSLKSEELNSIITKYKPSLISFVPTMFQNLIKFINHPWPELKQIFLGGGPIPNTIIEITNEKKWPISIVYGSTETSSMVTICSTSNLIDNGLSAGIPLQGVKIIINEFSDLNYVSIQSKTVAKSYYKANSELVSRLNNGRFSSNDLGEIDSRGNVQILGRGDEIIISGGENVSLIQIRKIINEKFIGLDFVNIGIKDEKWGQSYIIVVGSQEGDIEKRLEKYLADQLPKFKLPKRIFKLEKLPRTELGKLQKKEIQKLIKFDFL
ncbi:MAG: acyl--CoA ligase [Melioribacteraceae bacterium]|nr:acyl--CoA ligase [Melioribacteraceae bacterium]